MFALRSAGAEESKRDAKSGGGYSNERQRGNERETQGWVEGSGGPGCKQRANDEAFIYWGGISVVLEIHYVMRFPFVPRERKRNN